MTTNRVLEFLSWVPGAVLATLGVCLLAMVTGWISSILAGSRSPRGRGLRLFLAFPVTNPLALLVLLSRDPRAAVFPVGCYLVAVFSLPLGGAAAERIERARLAAYEQSLVKAGDSLRIDSLIPEPVPAEANIWEHPFLKPIAMAGRHGPEGEEAQATKRYEAIRVPTRVNPVRYLVDGQDRAARRDRPFRDPFHTLHAYALATDYAGEALPDGYAPESWAACGRLILEHFEPASADFAALEEALSRPHGQYPYAWEDGFNMLLPHLSRAKGFTQSLTCRSMAWATQGNSTESFRDTRTALALIRLGDSDLVISRLVQWAQTSIALDALLVAQQFHVWNDPQWSELQARLGELDFPAQTPSSLRAERIFGQTTIELMLAKPATEIIRMLDELGTGASLSGPGPGGARRTFKVLVDLLGSGLTRALVIREWHRALEAYQELIATVEDVLDRSRAEAWNDLAVSQLPENIDSYGILARLLLPALSTVFRKAIDVQTNVRLAIVACALERYYLVHGRYPESLSDLIPEYLPEPAMDPMTRQPWRYDRTGDRSFRLYSAGRNAVDDGGLYTFGDRTAGRPPAKDDFAWDVGAEPPALPVFVYEPPEAASSDASRMTREMMRRYGLMPSEPVSPATNSSAAPSR